MDLLQLQYFRTIAHLENLTKASEVLFVAQPNLSVSISRLEKDLGVSLFDRRRGKITLTATGRIFLTHVEQVLDELNTGISNARNAENVVKDRVRVAGSIVDLMADILLSFHPENKDVSIKQLNCPNSEIPGKVLSDDVDLGFVYGTPPLAGLEYTFLDSCERGLLVHKDHPQLRYDGAKVSIKEFSTERFICSMARDDGILLKELIPLTGFRPKVFFECDDMQFETNLIVAGRGIMFAPLSHYLKLIRADSALPLGFIRLKEHIPEAQIGVIRRQGGILTDASLQFFDHVDKFFQADKIRAQGYLDALAKY